jgi:ATP-dependent Clp protease ATP-binding subunit ClpX
MGFQADLEESRWNKADESDVLPEVMPEDLIKYGLIPEFVGRLPVVCTLHELDQDALVRILTEPANSLTKQYQKMFEFENVALKFTDDALSAIAEQALERKIGARGLRLIAEDLMLDVMYELPSVKKVKEFVVTREMVENKEVVFKLLEKAG